MAESTGTDYSKYILPVGLVLLAYGIYKSIFGSSGKTQNNVTVDTTTQDAVKATLQASSQVTPATITQAQAAAVANTVFGLCVNQEAGYQDAVEWEILDSVNNLTDLMLIMQYFGTRNVATSSFSLCAQLGINCTKVSMNQLVVGTLDAQHLNSINTFLSGAGINYQF